MADSGCNLCGDCLYDQLYARVSICLTLCVKCWKAAGKPWPGRQPEEVWPKNAFGRPLESQERMKQPKQSGHANGERKFKYE